MKARQTFGSLALALCAGFSVFLIIEVFIIASSTPDPRVTNDFSALFEWWRVIGTFCSVVFGILTAAMFGMYLWEAGHQAEEILASWFGLAGFAILGFTDHVDLAWALYITSSFGEMLRQKDFWTILWPWSEAES